MRNEQVGITIDGMQIFGACTDRMDPVTSYVETNNLEQVNTSACAEDAGCHSANLAGGLDLQVKRPLFGGGFSGTLGTGYQANGSGFNSVANLNYGAEKFSGNVNAVYRKQGNYTDGNDNEVLFTQFEKINVAANLGYRLAPNHILRFSFIMDDAYNVGYAALPMDVAFAKARIYGLGSTWYTSGFLKEIHAKAYYNFIDHAMDDSQRPDVPIRMDMPGQSETWGAFVEGKVKTMGRHAFYGKAEIFSNFRHAEMTMYPPNTTEPPMYMLTWPDVRKTSALIFISDKIALATTHTLTVNARLQTDYNQITTDLGKSFMMPFGYTGPSTFWLPMLDAQYSWQFAARHSVQATAGYSSRGPSTSEQYAFYLFNAYDGYDYIGNPNILAEQALKAQLGYTYTLPRWQLQVAGYGYRIGNYILGNTDSTFDAMTIGANGVRIYQNLPYATLLGADITANGTLAPWLALMAKVGYTRGKTNTGDNLPLMPPLNGVLSLKANYQRLQGMVEAELAAPQNQVNQMFGDIKTPGYAVLNLRALYTQPIGKTVLNIETGIDNLFDNAYRNHLDWGGAANLLRPGRNVYVQVKVGF
jgi:iron complex outermembrane receptor protein